MQDHAWVKRIEATFSQAQQDLMRYGQRKENGKRLTGHMAAKATSLFQILPGKPAEFPDNRA